MTGDTPAAWAPGSLEQRLFAPRSIALVGASSDPARNAARPQQYLRHHGYDGAVFPVNPSHEQVFGERAWRRVSDIDVPVEHAFVMVHPSRVEDALRDCARHGVPVTTIFSDGFAERSSEGAAAQDRLRAIAEDSGMRMLGPNCIGLVNVVDRVALTANGALAAAKLEAGSVAIVSQSGSMLGSLLSRGQARGIRFSRLVSVGNEADLAVGEIVDMLVGDPHTRAILLFLETLRDPMRLAAAARRAHHCGKVIIAYKLGRSDLGAALAVSHTGALAGSDAAVDAFLHEAGIARVDMMDSLIEIPPLLAQGPSSPQPGKTCRVAVLTTTGGGAAMVVDRIGARGLSIAAPSAEFRAQMYEYGVTIGEGAMIDLTLKATPRTYRILLDALLDAEFCDVVLAVVGSSALSQPELAVSPILEIAGARSTASVGHPLAVFLTPAADESLARLTQAGVAAFRTPEACADALAAFASWKRPEPRTDNPKIRLEGLPPPSPNRVVLDEARSLEIFERIGIPAVARVRLEPGVAREQLVDATRRIEAPWAVKLISPDLPHKTEAGAVELGVKEPVQAWETVVAMRERVRDRVPNAHVVGIYLQSMVDALAEAIVGYRRDPVVGPVVLLGVGGRLSEVYRDIAIRPAPVTNEQARHMIEEVRGLATIRGYRGMPYGDLAALENSIVACSRLALVGRDDIVEAEINPLLVCRKGVVAADGMFVLESSNMAGVPFANANGIAIGPNAGCRQD